jgi:hypothetical protein
MAVAAQAAFVDNDSHDEINIVLDGQQTVLAVGDCIKFRRNVGVNDAPFIKAKILNFGYSAGGPPNRIFFLPWREEGRWGGHVMPRRAIGLEVPYLGQNGDWASIVKIDCPAPAQAGGRRKNRKFTKKARKNRRRYSRRN